MSGYLNNLVRRTLALAPVVQPRLASVFETPVVMPAIKQAPVSEEVVRGASTQAATSPADRGPQVHTAVQVVSQQIEGKRDTRRKFATAAPGDVRTKPDLPRVNPPTQGSAVESQRFQRVAEPTSSQRVVISPVVAERHEGLPHKAQIVREAARNESESLWQRIEPRVRQVVKDELPATSLSERSVNKTEAVQPPVAPQTKRPSPEPVVPPSWKPEVIPTPSFVSPVTPEITVTIGRVDVRAIIAPSAQPLRREPTRESSPSALEQYLRTRSEGRR